MAVSVLEIYRELSLGQEKGRSLLITRGCNKKRRYDEKTPMQTILPARKLWQMQVRKRWQKVIPAIRNKNHG